MMLAPSPLFTDAFSVTPAPLVLRSPACPGSPQPTGGGAPAPVRGDAGAVSITATGALALWLPAWNVLMELRRKRLAAQR